MKELIFMANGKTIERKVYTTSEGFYVIVNKERVAVDKDNDVWHELAAQSEQVVEAPVAVEEPKQAESAPAATRENVKFIAVKRDCDNNVVSAIGAYRTRKEALSHCQGEDHYALFHETDTLCYDTAIRVTDFVEYYGDFQVQDGTMIWPIPVALAPELAAKATKDGAFAGWGAANLVVGHGYRLSGFYNWFDDGEILLNARYSSRGQAHECHVPAGAYAEWEKLFVEAYEQAYRQYKAEWQSRKRTVAAPVAVEAVAEEQAEVAPAEQVAESAPEMPAAPALAHPTAWLKAYTIDFSLGREISAEEHRDYTREVEWRDCRCYELLGQKADLHMSVQAENLKDIKTLAKKIKDEWHKHTPLVHGLEWGQGSELKERWQYMRVPSQPGSYKRSTARSWQLVNGFDTSYATVKFARTGQKG